MKYPRAIINISSLLHNLHLIRQLSPQTKVLAIVKANAYGHGLCEVAQDVFQYVDGVGVARVDEAEQIRAYGVDCEILLLEGFVGAVELFKASELGLSTVVHCFEQLELIEKYQQELLNLKVWIKFNTGMHRLGFDFAEVLEVKQRLDMITSVSQVNFMTHLSRADDLNQTEYTQSQFVAFKQLQELFPTQTCSISASSGILNYKQKPGEWIRPGIILYGISPNYKPISQLGFRPVMNLETMLISIHKRKAGESIGYGGVYTIPHDTYIGVVAIGYGDGYPRLAPEGTPVYLNGRTVPIVGRVSMDMITVDLGPVLQDKVGDNVVIFGKELPIEQIAKHIGISTYELTTSLTERVQMHKVLK